MHNQLLIFWRATSIVTHLRTTYLEVSSKMASGLGYKSLGFRRVSAEVPRAPPVFAECTDMGRVIMDISQIDLIEPGRKNPALIP